MSLIFYTFLWHKRMSEQSERKNEKEQDKTSIVHTDVYFLPKFIRDKIYLVLIFL